ncbi:MAG: SPOR domain-containing protein, partial [Hyphomicrobium sp.]
FKGKFRLQVAAVRSRAEAEELALKLKQAHGSAIGGREPAIEQSVIGAMGTFYRVRVGPYADANEPRQLCARIKPDGFDCLVVTQ